jgi:Tfp pilus assembly protein FimT
MIEVMVAVTLIGLITLAAVPAMTNIVKRNKLDTVTRQILGDVREARSRAITAGWEYRVQGWHATTGGTRKNQYRTFGRKTAATSWPATECAPFSSSTQYASTWTDVSAQKSGVSMVPSTGTSFTLAFGPRGTATDTTGFAPLTFTNSTGSKTITVSPTGMLKVQ